MIKKIVSGAQTGADRAALDAAMDLGLTCGGWVPRGRLAEDGIIPEYYPNLKETPNDNLDTRTEWNIRDSDATLILSHGPLDGGSLYTRQMVEKMSRPFLHLDLDKTGEDRAVQLAREWVTAICPRILNVAGPRASKDPLIYDVTVNILKRMLK